MRNCINCKHGDITISKYPCNVCDDKNSKWEKGKTINLWMVLSIILIVAFFIQAGAFTADLQEQDKIIAQLQQPQQSNKITITEPITLIRTVEDYTYLNSLEIDRNIWDNATKHTDINGVTWREIIEDGYIKVYAEGHVMPDSIHWYAPY